MLSLINITIGLAVRCSLESQDTSLKLCQSVSDLVVGPGQRRYRVLHLPHCQGKLLRSLTIDLTTDTARCDHFPDWDPLERNGSAP